jgi:hypothetical protein
MTYQSQMSEKFCAANYEARSSFVSDKKTHSDRNSSAVIDSQAMRFMAASDGANIRKSLIL